MIAILDEFYDREMNCDRNNCYAECRDEYRRHKLVAWKCGRRKAANAREQIWRLQPLEMIFSSLGRNVANDRNRMTIRKVRVVSRCDADNNRK